MTSLGHNELMEYRKTHRFDLCTESTLVTPEFVIFTAFGAISGEKLQYFPFSVRKNSNWHARDRLECRGLVTIWNAVKFFLSIKEITVVCSGVAFQINLYNRYGNVLLPCNEQSGHILNKYRWILYTWHVSIVTSALFTAQRHNVKLDVTKWKRVPYYCVTGIHRSPVMTLTKGLVIWSFFASQIINCINSRVYFLLPWRWCDVTKMSDCVNQ